MPDTTGLKHEVIIQKLHRMAYDQSIRLSGARLVEIGDGETAPVEAMKQRRPRGRGLGFRLGALACAAGSALSLGCASLGRGSADGAGDAAYRDQAPPEYDFLLAQLLEFDEQIPEAAEAYRRAAAKDPDSVFLQRKLAELAARQDQLDDALQHAQRAHDLEPSDPQARVLLGNLHYLNHDLLSAEAVLRDESGRPASPDAAVLLYQIEMAASRYGEAVDVASWLVAQDPGAVRPYQALATAYDKLGLLPEAAQTLRDALEIEASNLAILAADPRRRTPSFLSLWTLRSRIRSSWRRCCSRVSLEFVMFRSGGPGSRSTPSNLA